MSCRPSAPLGVPTQTIAMSAFASSSPGAMAADSSPSARPLEISSGRPGSSIGQRPVFSASTFAWLTSIPTTR